MNDIILTLADDYAASYANVIDSMIKRQKLADEITRLREDLAEAKREAWERSRERDIEQGNAARLRLAFEALTAEAESLRKDAERLDWMSAHEAWIGWNREGDFCRVFVRTDEEGGHPYVPVCGWMQFFETPRDAIDAAIAKDKK